MHWGWKQTFSAVPAQSSSHNDLLYVETGPPDGKLVAEWNQMSSRLALVVTMDSGPAKGVDRQKIVTAAIRDRWRILSCMPSTISWKSDPQPVDGLIWTSGYCPCQGKIETMKLPKWYYPTILEDKGSPENGNWGGGCIETQGGPFHLGENGLWVDLRLSPSKEPSKR